MEKKPPILFIILLIFYLINSNTVSCQIKTEKDSLSTYTFKELHNKSYAAKPDTIKSLLYAKYHLKKALKNKDTIKIASSYYIISSITNETHDFINYWNEILSNKDINQKLQIIGNLELGDFYFQKGRHHRALSNYLKAKRNSLKNKEPYNKNLEHKILLRIGIIKMENKEPEEAIILYKQSFKLFNTIEIDKNILDDYYSLLINMSSTYLSLEQYDSAIFYNSKARILAIKFKDSTLYSYALLIYGKIELKKHNYRIAIDGIKKSIPWIVNDENYSVLSFIYLSIGKSYSKLNDDKNSLNFYLKVDSLFLSNKNYYKSQKPAYKFLISHYKENNNDEKQLEYINKYIKVDSVLNARAKNISKNLTENYDIPNLIAEKQLIENRLKGNLSTTKKWMIGVSSFAFIILLFLIQQNRRRKLYKKRFQQLINSSKPILKEKKNVKKGQLISEEIIQSISIYLEQFEKNQEFLSSGITLSSLAKTFETNSKYLSQFINQQKEQSFNNYMNRLRINYTIEKLKEDSRFRKYSIKAIANEVGFNTSESFSKAFYKNTGIKPSYFIKELEKK